MATLVELVKRGDLVKIDPALDIRAQEFRVLYASPRLVKWLQQTLPNLGSTWNIEVSPLEQLDAFLAVYASDEPLTYKHAFKPINHVAGGVWELKTADIRIFGWFPMKDCFIAHVANSTEMIKRHKLYHGHAGEVAKFRDGLDLDEPKYLTGTEPDDVVSTFCYP